MITCYVAGGSGGHILPVIALAQEWIKNNNGTVVFFTSTGSIDKTIFRNKSDYKVIQLELTKFSGKKIYLYPRFIFDFIYLFLKSFFILRKLQPSTITTTGGYISIPVCLAGRLLGVSIDFYELNAVPGKAAYVLGRLAKNIYVVFEDCAKYFSNKVKCVSYPLRFTEIDKLYDKERIVRDIGLQNKTTIFILGGSQGSLFINLIFKKWIEKNEDLYSSLQVIHQTGSFDTTDWNAFYSELGISYKVFDYCDDVKKYYQVADIIICRAGAGTLFELEFFKKTSLIIPLETAYTKHQVDNAIYMAKKYPDQFYYLKQDNLISFDSIIKELFRRNINVTRH